ncbi:MAG: hypothetical protein U0271_26790 [Polyangiaceae bacterium]
MNLRGARDARAWAAVLLLAVGCGDDTSATGGTGAGGSSNGGSSAGGSSAGGYNAGGSNAGGSNAGGSNAGGTGGGGSNAGGAGGGFAGGCADLVGSCLASNGICSDYGVGGPDPVNCTNAGFVWVEESCVTRPDADVGAGCMGTDPYCGIVWYPVTSAAAYPMFQMTCENSGQMWIVL